MGGVLWVCFFFPPAWLAGFLHGQPPLAPCNPLPFSTMVSKFNMFRKVTFKRNAFFNNQVDSLHVSLFLKNLNSFRKWVGPLTGLFQQVFVRRKPLFFLQMCLFLVPGSEFLPSKTRFAGDRNLEITHDFMFSDFFFARESLSCDCVAFQFTLFAASCSFRSVYLCRKF